MFRSAVLLAALLCVPVLAGAQTVDGRLKKIKDAKSIAIAYRSDAAPFSFVDEAKKEPAGYSIELCRKVAAAIGKQIGIEGLPVNWVPVTVQNRMEAVEKGQADMECGSTTVTLSRMKNVSFSSFIFVDGTGLLVKADSPVRQLTDLSGRKVGVIPGTTNEKALNDVLGKGFIKATVVPLKNRDEGLAQIEAGQIDAFASDKVLLLALSPKAKNPKALALLTEDLSYEPYAITLPRNDDSFRLAVNAALAEIYRSGAITEIFNRWFGSMGKPGLMIQAAYVLGAIPE
jgi:ABC-type amino acid transport substrate-binding protein